MSSHARPDADRRSRLRRGAFLVLFALAGTLALAAAALAAKPKPGARFSGKTVAFPINGFSPPVTFTVSSDGRSLLNFKYSSLGCQGAGGFRPGIDYFTQADAIHRIGTVKLSKGVYAAKGAVSTFTVMGQTTTTTSSVVVRFSSSKKASGTIAFSQKFNVAHVEPCKGSIGFTASGR